MYDMMYESVRPRQMLCPVPLLSIFVKGLDNSCLNQPDAALAALLPTISSEAAPRELYFPLLFKPLLPFISGMEPPLSHRDAARPLFSRLFALSFHSSRSFSCNLVD